MLKDIIENHRTLGEALETVSVRCRYCKQIMLVEVTPEMKNNSETLDDVAIETCQCVSAKNETKRKSRIEKIDEKLENCIGSASESPVDAEVFEIIKSTAKNVCFEKLEKATFKLTGTDKVTLSTDSNGRLKIDREQKKKTTGTI